MSPRWHIAGSHRIRNTPAGFLLTKQRGRYYKKVSEFGRAEIKNRLEALDFCLGAGSRPWDCNKTTGLSSCGKRPCFAYLGAIPSTIQRNGLQQHHGIFSLRHRYGHDCRRSPLLRRSFKNERVDRQALGNARCNTPSDGLCPHDDRAGVGLLGKRVMPLRIVAPSTVMDHGSWVDIRYRVPRAGPPIGPRSL